ncbi:HCL447Wp [Eremothecium sinecaudum]|uniref:HCL447Wp n=1 Tax=Eremothecium sinecaudum TaxID=45286 RepID=A0A109UY84_9SACH|nr:HCL447Wp [Eremothecium sinecaudum]AMD19704.1 HCL447Wp [Eremothecium sinecaudum]
MNFIFKSISSFQFPYTLHSDTAFSTPFWEVQQGTRKSDSLPVTLFAYSKQDSKNALLEEFIRNAVHKAKTLKLPGLVRVLDVLDSDPNMTYIVTERVQRLFPEILKNISEDAISLGLYQVLGTLKLLHERASVLLGTLAKGNVYVNDRGEWCLFGLELCTSKGQLQNLKVSMKTYMSLVDNSAYALPTKESLNIDSVHLAALIKDVYGPKVPGSWKSQLNGLSQGRCTVSEFASFVSRTAPFQCQLIAVYEHLKEVHIKDDAGKMLAVNEIQAIIMENPGILCGSAPGFVDNYLIQVLAETIQIGMNANRLRPETANFTNIVPLVASILELSCSKSKAVQFESTFDKYVKPLIFDNYKISDRQLRYLLLLYIPGYVDKLTKNELQNQVFPYFIQGMVDSDFTIRFQTLKRTSFMVGKITERQLNNDLLRHLAKTQVDSEIDIRMWTILTITEIADKLSSNERSSILGTAFSKSLKDPAILPRVAALYGLKKSLHLFDAETIANKILSVVAPGLLDKNKQVRSQAKEVFELYLKKLVERSVSVEDTTTGEDFVDVDFDSMLSSSQDDLVNNFLDNLKISAKTNKNVLTRTANSDEWDDVTADDSWSEVEVEKSNKLPINSNASKLTSKNSDMKTQVSTFGEVAATKPTFGSVKVQKSWNEELNDGDDGNDSWAAWDNENKNTRSRKVHTTVKTAKAVKPVSIKKTASKDLKKVIDDNGWNDGDDGWTDEW